MPGIRQVQESDVDSAAHSATMRGADYLCLWCLLWLVSAWSMAPKTKAASKKKAAGGFGKKPVSSKRKVSSAVLLEKSETLFSELEKKFDGVDDALFWREYVVAVRSREGVRQLRDWVPVAVQGVATSAAADVAVPTAMGRCKRELAESVRGVLGGVAQRQFSISAVDLSYEPLVDWEKRVLDALEASASDRHAAVARAAQLLGVDLTADAAQVKSAFRAQARLAHPDSSDGDDADLPTVGELKSAHDVLVDRRELSYETLGLSAGKSTFSGAIPLPDDDDNTRIPNLQAAVSRLDPDLVTPFLFRNSRLL